MAAPHPAPTPARAPIPRPSLSRLPLLALSAACSGTPVVGLIPVEHNKLATIVAVTEKVPVWAEGRCVADDDRDDVRLLARQGPDELLDLPLAGLREDTDWTCTVDVDNGKRVKRYTLPVVPGPVPLKVGGYSIEGATDPAGATLFTAWDHDYGQPNMRTVIVDALGRVRWYRFTDYEVVAALDGTVTSAGRVLTGGGPDQPPTWYDALGDVRAALGEPPTAGAYHHHVEPFGDGVVALTNALNHRADGSDFTGFGLVIFDATGAPEWVYNSQQAVDEGTLVPTLGSDPFHANAVTLLDDPLGPAAWVSLYRPGVLVRIDRDTGAITHTLGASGDFELVDGERWFFGQHDPEFDWPRVLIYDNGLAHGQSRVVELELDLDALTATQTWEWTEPDWFEPFFGDADAVPGGVLIARGRCWEECDSTRPVDDRLADLVEVDRSSGAVRWRLVPPDRDRGFYRAERIDPCLLWEDPAICGPTP